MPNINISKEPLDATHGRYLARIAGVEGEAEITFTMRAEKVISADHTGVPDSMAGQGVAKALLNFMLDDARETQFKIIPICPFVRAQYASHPEWRPLFTTEPGEDPAN